MKATDLLKRQHKDVEMEERFEAFRQRGSAAA
jgi:hypothetical protein